ncbi:hypothetical protein R3P38DRAFT_3206131 [Favolaschia claudopus]|uniref:Uncharacterized protein n=1 Tax=Favolaschia claudopus TaxID=2862362 RepID=A0AAW0AN40_9AGAR
MSVSGDLASEILQRHHAMAITCDPLAIRARIRIYSKTIQRGSPSPAMMQWGTIQHCQKLYSSFRLNPILSLPHPPHGLPFRPGLLSGLPFPFYGDYSPRPSTPSSATSHTIRLPHSPFSCTDRYPTAHNASRVPVFYTCTTSTTPTTQRTSDLTPSSAGPGVGGSSASRTSGGIISGNEDRQGVHVPCLLGFPPRPKHVYRPRQHAFDGDGDPYPKPGRVRRLPSSAGVSADGDDDDDPT